MKIVFFSTPIVIKLVNSSLKDFVNVKNMNWFKMYEMVEFFKILIYKSINDL